MSAVVGLFSREDASTEPGVLARMLSAMQGRGSESSSFSARRGGVVAVARHPWELQADFSGPIFIGHDGDLIAAVDASLYYVADLVRGLRTRGVPPRSHTPTDLILAAYRAWGEECVDHLEGDYALIVWDAAARRVFAARDFQGKRPLYYAFLDDQLIIASQPDAVLAHPRCSEELNLASLAEDASLLTGSETQTCFRDVYRVPAGNSLRWTPGAAPELERFWRPPVFADIGGGAVDAIAEQLRLLLADAVGERLASGGTSALWMSGGWDSPALFATGKYLLGVDSHRTLQPVSLSFPEGDPGRENERITEIAEFWGATPDWIDVEAIDNAPERLLATRGQGESFIHLFEAANRALASETARIGGRVALDGNGGDHLFQVSDVYLADLLRTKSWISLAGQYRRRRNRIPHFYAAALKPNLARFWRILAQLSNDRQSWPDAPNARPAPPWIRRDFVQRYSLADRERSHTALPSGLGHAASESCWYFTNPAFHRAAATVFQCALESGVEHRSPFMDQRLVAFAASRPVSERNWRGERKRMLRHAMRGLLPSSVLAGRAQRTGVPIGHLASVALRTVPPVLESGSGSLLLADLGIVDQSTLRSCWSRAAQQSDWGALVGIYCTTQVELWLRARSQHFEPGSGAADRSGLAAEKNQSRMSIRTTA